MQSAKSGVSRVLGLPTGLISVPKKAEVEALKRKAKKRRTIKASTPEIKEEEEESIDKDISESKSDCIIVASSRSKSR
jgi:hypothetical protein